LLSDIARTQPWLRNRVRRLRIHYRQLQDGIAALDDDLDAAARHRPRRMQRAADGPQANLGLRSMWTRIVVPACPVLIST
jgi:hypothetical protein